MSNRFGTDIIIRTPDPKKAAAFYVKNLGFQISEENPDLISVLGPNINLFIEKGRAHGPVLEVLVPDVAATKQRLIDDGGKVVLDEPRVPRTYIRDPYGITYNVAEGSPDGES